MAGTRRPASAIPSPISTTEGIEAREMNDALRTKLNLILVAVLAFALGLGFAAKLDLTPQSFATGSAHIQFGASEEQLQQLRKQWAGIIDGGR